MIDDLNGLDFADAAEEFGKVAFGGIVAEVADMEAGSGEGLGVWGSGGSGLALGAVFPGGAVAAIRAFAGARSS